MISNHQERTLRELVAVAARYRIPLVTFVASAIISSIAITFIASERYRAGTLVMYRPTEPIDIESKVIVPNQTAFGFPVPSMPFEALGATIEQVGGSERVLRKVVVDLGLDQPDTVSRAGFEWFLYESKELAKLVKARTWEFLKYGRILKKNPTTQAIIELAHNTTFETAKNYTTRLSVSDSNPVMAARIVDAIAQELIVAMTELGVEPMQERALEIEKRIASTEQEIQAVYDEIGELKATGNFVSLEEETILHLRSIEELVLKSIEGDKRARDITAQLNVVTRQRKSLDSTVKKSETVQDDPRYNQLRALEAQYEIELEGLSNRLSSNHVDVVSIEAKLATTRKLLMELEPQRISSVTTEVNPLREQLLATEYDLKAQLEGIEAANASTAASIATIREKIAQHSVASKVEDLSLRLEVLQSNYTRLATAKEEAYALALARFPEVTALFKATPMDAPFRPIRIYHVALTAFLSLALGFGVIYLIDFTKMMWMIDSSPSMSMHPTESTGQI